MTAVTLTELSVSDLPMNVASGTVKRRVLAVVRYTSSVGKTETLNLATYIPGAADIEGLMWNTLDDAVATTALTWSTTTITAAGDAGDGEFGAIVNIT